MKTQKSQKLYSKAKSIIPGGTQLLSKRPEMFAPEVWPAYFSKARVLSARRLRRLVWPWAR